MAGRAEPNEEPGSDEARRQRRLKDPDVQTRIQEIREAMKHEHESPGVDAKELGDLLGKHG